MKDKMLSKQEQELLQKVIDDFEAFIEVYSKSHEDDDQVGEDPNFGDSQLDRIYAMSFALMVADVTKDLAQIRSLLRIKMEEYIDVLTANGRTIDQVEHNLMFRMMLKNSEVDEIKKHCRDNKD